MTLQGEELVGIPMPEPAGSVRLLLPEPDGLVIPTWAANNFVFADGRRPTLRTLTPVGTDPDRGELAVEIVRHGAVAPPPGPSTHDPVTRARCPARRAATCRPPTRARFLLGGDETALPALAQLAAAVPPGVPAEILAEVPDPAARLPITDRPGITVTWLDGSAGVPGAALADAFSERRVDADTHVWAGGEAAAMQRIRRHLYETLGVERARATARGYWKHGRSASSND